MNFVQSIDNHTYGENIGLWGFDPVEMGKSG